MILALLATALAGSITLDIEVAESTTTMVDFGQVSLGTGSSRAGRRFESEDSTFLVVEVSATATWTNDTPVFQEEPVRGALFGNLFTMSRTLTAPPATRMSRDEAKSPPMTVDLYVQTTRERGDSVLWLGPLGTSWDKGAGNRVLQTPTQVAAGIPLGRDHRHELALEITPQSSGIQQKELVYTVIVP